MTRSEYRAQQQAKKIKQERGIIVALIIIILAGIIMGIGILSIPKASGEPINQIMLLARDNRALRSQVTSLTSEVATLTAQYSALTTAHATLEKEYREQKVDYKALQSKYEALKATKLVTTSSASTSNWQSATVSWYGPGFYGNHTANGEVLTTTMMNFAHKTMAFGTKVEFSYNGKTCIAYCNDRGPFVEDRTFDLGPGTAKALGFSGVQTIKWRIVK